MRRFEGPSWRLTKLENRTYRAIAELGSDPVTGRRRTGSRKFMGTRAQVKAAAEEWFADLCDRTADPDMRGRAEQLLSAYLASWLESKRGTIKDSAWSRYDSLIRTSLSPALGWVRLCDLSPQHIRHYVAQCRLEPSTHRPGQMVSPKTMQNRLGVLGTALRQAVREGLINRNPLDAVDKPRVSRTPLKIVGEPEAAKVRKAAEGTDLEMIVRMALATGARLGELLALRWRDIDLEHRRVNISRTISERAGKRSTDWYVFTEPKGRRGRTVDIAASTVEALKRYRASQSAVRLQFGKTWDDHGLVFPNVWQLRDVAPGSPLRVSTVSRQFHKLATDSGLEGVRFHDLRHAYATIALRNGVSVNAVAEALGHADPAMTLRVYSHVLPGQQREAADLIDAAIEKAYGAL
jgi:integrase